jgi:hypothetical protein
MSPPEKPRREIGFHVKYDDDKPKAKKRCGRLSLKRAR